MAANIANSPTQPVREPHHHGRYNNHYAVPP
jgi:hypothetical protein